MHELSHKTDSQNAGLFMPSTRDLLIFKLYMLRCMSLHPSNIPAFASQLQRWHGSGLLVHLH